MIVFIVIMIVTIVIVMITLIVIVTTVIAIVIVMIVMIVLYPVVPARLYVGNFLCITDWLQQGFVDDRCENNVKIITSCNEWTHNDKIAHGGR